VLLFTDSRVSAGHPDASRGNVPTWAARLPVATYAIDDDTALKVVDESVEVVSEGSWQLFAPG
jgi:dipeptidase E